MAPPLMAFQAFHEQYLGLNLPHYSAEPDPRNLVPQIEDPWYLFLRKKSTEAKRLLTSNTALNELDHNFADDLELVVFWIMDLYRRLCVEYLERVYNESDEGKEVVLQKSRKVSDMDLGTLQDCKGRI